MRLIITKKKKTPYIYEKKFQQTSGSADEKPKLVPLKFFNLEKLVKLLGQKEYFILIFLTTGLKSQSIEIC